MAWIFQATPLPTFMSVTSTDYSKRELSYITNLKKSIYSK